MSSGSYCSDRLSGVAWVKLVSVKAIGGMGEGKESDGSFWLSLRPLLVSHSQTQGYSLQRTAPHEYLSNHLYV